MAYWLYFFQFHIFHYYSVYDLKAFHRAGLYYKTTQTQLIKVRWSIFPTSIVSISEHNNVTTYVCSKFRFTRHFSGELQHFYCRALTSTRTQFHDKLWNNCSFSYYGLIKNVTSRKNLFIHVHANCT